MPAGIVPDEGLSDQITNVLTPTWNTAGYAVGLFTTNLTLTQATTWSSDVTSVEATWGGYAQIPLGTPTSISSPGPGEEDAVYASYVFTYDGSGTPPYDNYGWFVLDVTNAVLLSIGLFSTNHLVTVNGDAIAVNLTAKLLVC